MITATVRDIVNLNLISLDTEKTVKDAAKIMVEHNIGAVVITSSGEPVGIVTERDILRKVTFEARDPSFVRLGSIMSAPLITVSADASLGDATLIMSKQKIRRLLATDQGRIIGIFTLRDLQERVLDVFMALRSAVR